MKATLRDLLSSTWPDHTFVPGFDPRSTILLAPGSGLIRWGESLSRWKRVGKVRNSVVAQLHMAR
jgi:hypothetical protein